MLRHKNIDRVCCVILALTLLVSTLFVGAAASGLITEDTTIGYETRLFDQSRVHTIDIVMENWEAFLDTCTAEEYAACHLVIDGESYKNVAIRGKGNTSLSSVATYGNDRYSFKVEFDHYQSGLTYHGLDKLSLNNLIQDNTYMKDYFAYTLMNKMGVAAPLCSFVQINVNGEPWGLYLAVEGVEDAFLQRNYGKNYGELYKPDSMSFGGGRGNGMDFDMEEMAEKFGFSFDGEDGETPTFTMPDMGNMPAAPGNFDFSDFKGSFGGFSGEQAASTATAMPEPTATQSADSFGGSGGASSGEMPDMSGMPQMPTGGEMPDMSGMPQMPTSGEMPDMSSMPQMPTSGEMPDMSGMPQMPTGGEMPNMGGMPQMPTSGEMPDMGNMPNMGQMGGMQIPGGFDPNQSTGTTDTAAPAMPTGSETPDMSSMPQMSASGEMPDMSSMPQMPEGMEMPDMGGFGMGSDDVKLVYSDDDPDSYSNIFNNAKTDVSEADQTRLIAAIKALNEGDTSVVDTDAVIRYMAVHNFLCNDDSYTGMMVHNYYLYEEDGVLSMIPWDYNLAYGGFSMGGFGGSSGATSSVNSSISRLVSNGSDSDRPMAGWITTSEEYTAQYLELYQQFVTEAFDSGWFAEEIDRVTAMIDPYVQADPTAFCTYEEFQTAAETLKSFCLLRAESVQRQLNGDATQVDASELDLSVMGTMGFGGGFGGGMERPDGGDKRGGRGERTRGDAPANGTQPTAEAPAQGTPPEMPASGTAQPEDAAPHDPPSFEAFEPGEKAQQSNTEALLLLGISVFLLAAALIFVKRCRTER